MPRPVDLATMLDKWNVYLLEWALLLAAIATMTMALLELAKVVVAARRRYHEQRVTRWVGPPKAYTELLALAVGGSGSKNALYDQPTNKMMGQIQAAANTAMDFPTRYGALYEFLTAPPTETSETPETKDPKAAQQNATDAKAAERDERLWAEFCKNLEAGQKIDPADEQQAGVIAAATRARARLDHFVARRLDAFQTVTEYQWARWNQIISVIGAAAFLMYLLYTTAGGDLTWRMVVVALFGGMIAPLAKDLVEALSGLRARRT